MSVLVAEVGKLPAFVRRDFLIAISYRAVFVMEVVHLIANALVFALIGELVDQGKMPAYGGEQASYVQFVAVGIAFNLVLAVGMNQVQGAVRTEQMTGTLESLLATPTRMPTIQAGSAAYAILTVPLRVVLFGLIMYTFFDLRIDWPGIAPAAVVTVLFLPFIWGIGLVGAAAALTFRRGGNATALVALGLGLTSGAFFPLSLLPGLLADVAALNPIAVALEAIREALLGGAGWGALDLGVVALVPVAAMSLLIGGAAFQWALRREVRRGTLGLY